MDLTFDTVLAVAVIALLAPVVVQVAPPLRLPAVVLEIVLGIAIGPSGLDWFSIDVPTNVLALFGLGFLLFLAGLEIDPERLKHGDGRVAVGYALSVAIALGVGVAVAVFGETSSPLFIAIALSSTSLGLVVPVLSDAGETNSDFGQSRPRRQLRGRVRVDRPRVLVLLEQRLGNRIDRDWCRAADRGVAVGGDLSAARARAARGSGVSVGRCGEREVHAEGGAGAQCRVELDTAAVRIHERGDDSETEACSTPVSRP